MCVCRHVRRKEIKRSNNKKNERILFPIIVRVSFSTMPVFANITLNLLSIVLIATPQTHILIYFLSLSPYYKMIHFQLIHRLVEFTTFRFYFFLLFNASQLCIYLLQIRTINEVDSVMHKITIYTQTIVINTTLNGTAHTYCHCIINLDNFIWHAINTRFNRLENTQLSRSQKKSIISTTIYYNILNLSFANGQNTKSPTQFKPFNIRFLGWVFFSCLEF